MLINWHAHALPPEIQALPMWQGRCPANIERLLEIHEENSVDLAVVSNTIHYLKGKSDAEALPLVQRANEYAASIQQQHPERTVAFAASIPGGGDPFLKELERAIEDYKLKGVLI